jgi:F0F1-type ATP synthase beta subunit
MEQPSNILNANSESDPGTVTRVRGSVVDVEFVSGPLPAINDALTIELDSHDLLVSEIQEHLDLHTVRAVAMENTSGLRRGAIARRGDGPIRVPVGEKVLGRLIDAIGDPIDRLGPIQSGATRWPIHRSSPRSIIRITSARSSVPASRLPTFSHRSRAGAKPGCSAAPASARPC